MDRHSATEKPSSEKRVINKPAFALFRHLAFEIYAVTPGLISLRHIQDLEWYRACTFDAPIKPLSPNRKSPHLLPAALHLGH
jgi:hypothetical protein